MEIFPIPLPLPFGKRSAMSAVCHLFLLVPHVGEHDKMAGQAAKAGTGRLHVLDVCPQLILQDRTKRFYDGYITVCVSKGKTVWLSNAYW